jgi:hypothetical protein
MLGCDAKICPYGRTSGRRPGLTNASGAVLPQLETRIRRERVFSSPSLSTVTTSSMVVCTENPIGVDDVMEPPKLAG